MRKTYTRKWPRRFLRVVQGGRLDFQRAVLQVSQWGHAPLSFCSNLVLQCSQGFAVHFAVFYSAHIFLQPILQHFAVHSTAP